MTLSVRLEKINAILLSYLADASKKSIPNLFARSYPCLQETLRSSFKSHFEPTKIMVISALPAYLICYTHFSICSKLTGSMIEQVRTMPWAPLQKDLVIFLNLYWPAVSQIFRVTGWPLCQILLILKSTPMVLRQSVWNVSSQYLTSKLVFPTPLSPTTNSFKVVLFGFDMCQNFYIFKNYKYRLTSLTSEIFRTVIANHTFLVYKVRPIEYLTGRTAVIWKIQSGRADSQLLNIRMPVYKSKSTHQNTRCFLTLNQDLQSPMEYVRASGNNLAVIDQDGRIIQQFHPNSKILPVNLTNDQICERTLLDGIQQLSIGMNMSVFYVGSTFSGKEKLADGTKSELPLCEYLFDRIYNSQRRKNRQTEYRLKMIVIINQKVYDCFGDSKTNHIKLKEEKWEGVQPTMSKTVTIGSPQDFGAQLSRAIKQKNKLVLQLKDYFSTHLCLELIQSHPDDPKQNLVSKLNVFEIGGVQSLNTAHSFIKIKDSPTSTRSLVGFSSLVNEMAKFPDSVIHYEASQLTYILKEIVGCNSTLYAFLTVKVSDIEGTMSTMKFLKPLETIEQFPLINDSLGYGTIKKFRHWALHNGMHNENQQLDNEKRQLEEEMLRLQTQQDYKRLLEKYTELKQKYSQALKAKSEAQLELIKSQEEKLQIGKSLVQIQIQNAKLLEKLQNKDYENGKKLLNAENLLAQREMSYQECLDKINQLKSALDQALETKRQLQVEFIALKRNFLLQQKQLKQLREDNQNLGVDVINLSKENEKLRKNILEDSNGFAKNKSNIPLRMEQQRMDELTRINKKNEETIAYLKSEVERYKKQIIQLQMSANGMNPGSGDEFGKDYRRIELENQNMELQNRFRLQGRKIEELQQKIGFYMEENQQLEIEVKECRQRDHDQTEQYRNNMGKFAKNTSAESVVKELKQNFSRKDAENLDKINSLKRDLSEKKKQIINLKGYIRQLVALLEEWGPKGLDVPSIKKYQNMDLSAEKGTEATEELRIRNIRLEEQIRRLKSLNSSSGMKESRAINQINMLKQSGVSNGGSSDILKLKKEKNELAEENRRLTVLLKDGNKMDLNILKKENQNLKREIEALKSSTSISPSTSDQKLKFYEKHLKLLEKERSELLSRAVVAEEQLKNLLAKVSNGKAKS